MKKKISRRKFLAILGVTSGVLVAGGVGGVAYVRSQFIPDTTPGPGTNGEVVTVAEGQLQGTINDGVYRYLGVPYAEAAERFVPAESVTPWEGIRKADSYGSMSPQGSMLGFGAGSQDGTDNNCQNLNIWTPGLNDDGLRPVLVWLHGGGFSTGTANDSSYDGEALAKNGDVVVVGINHRLNVFGYLDLSAYDEKYKDSANVGMWDIIAALEWIQQNIEVFGGDPDNVTVFGQSGGGAKVLGLMSTPYAAGLFHKGIVESGVTETDSGCQLHLAGSQHSPSRKSAGGAEHCPGKHRADSDHCCGQTAISSFQSTGQNGAGISDSGTAHRWLSDGVGAGGGR